MAQAILLQDSSRHIADRILGVTPLPLKVVAAYYNLVPAPQAPPPGAPENGRVTLLPIPGITPAATP